MAKLYFSYSTMNAGKSTALLQASYNYRERGMHTLLFTAAHYAQDGKAEITSRLGVAAEAEMFTVKDDMFAWVKKLYAQEPVACVFVDEAQFLTPEQVWQLARVADRLNVPVMAFGLRTDFQGKLFPGSKELLAIADNLREIRTICHCGSKATMVVRYGEDGKVMTEGAQVAVEKTIYVSLCRKHWEEEMGRWVSKDGRSPAIRSTQHL